MAIYHTSVKTFSRARGQSAVAAAAYRGGLRLKDFQTGQVHDYQRRSGVVASRCVVPPGAPPWALIPGELWPAVEAAERRKDATIAREFEVSLPHELDAEQRSELAWAIAEVLVERYGFAVQASIHAPAIPDGLNHHVHILASTRRITEQGFCDKTKELDGGPTGRIEVEWVREAVASTINSHLEAAGIRSRVDHRSLEEQSQMALLEGDPLRATLLSREPTRHQGKVATALARKGQVTHVEETNLSIQQENEEEFESLIQDAVAEGRAIGLPPTHDHRAALAERAKQKSDAPVLVVGDLKIEGVMGIRLPPIENGVWGPERPPRHWSCLEWIDVALRDLWEITQARADLALGVVREWLAGVRRHVVRFGDTVQARPLVASVAVKIRTLKQALLRRGRGESAVRRADRLHHMAQQQWEGFNADHPREGSQWSPKEWAKRRGRRLAVLEMRSIELAKAQERATQPALDAAERDILQQVSELAQSCGELPAFVAPSVRRVREVPRPGPASRPSGPPSR